MYKELKELGLIKPANYRTTTKAQMVQMLEEYNTKQIVPEVAVSITGDKRDVVASVYYDKEFKNKEMNQDTHQVTVNGQIVTGWYNKA